MYIFSTLLWLFFITSKKQGAIDILSNSCYKYKLILNIKFEKTDVYNELIDYGDE